MIAKLQRPNHAFREDNMSQNWPTRDKDLQAARVIMEEYASDRESDTLGLLKS